MNSIIKRRPSPALLVALVALFVAFSGTATAALVMTGKNIKDGTITGKDVKNGTLATKKLSKKAVTSLRGQRGVTGPQGPAGPQGAAGPQGPPGTPDGYTKAQADATFLGRDAVRADFTDLAPNNARDDSFVVVPGLLHLEVKCAPNGQMTMSYENDSEQTIKLATAVIPDNALGPEIRGGTITAGANSQVQGTNTAAPMLVRVHARKADGRMATILVTSATDPSHRCQLWAQTSIADAA